MKIDVNPQEVMILAEQMLADGWIKGAEKGPARHYHVGDQDAYGVCVVGALRETLQTVLRPQIEATLIEVPEFMAAPLRFKQEYVTNQTREMAQRLLDIFRPRIERVLGGGIGIESWNDAASRKKQEVLEAMRASLEIITTECNEIWQAEGEAALREDHFQQPADAVTVQKPA